jgi:TATA-binding protein-associated factor
MLQRFLSAIIAEEWAQELDTASKAKVGSPTLLDQSSLARELSSRTLAWLQNPPPAAYHEMTLTLHRIHGECTSLLHMFVTDCKLPSTSIPMLGTEIDITGTKPGSFTIDSARAAVGPMFNRLKETLGRAKKKELAIIMDKRIGVETNINRYSEVKAQYDIRVSAAFAAAFVAFHSAPDKVSPVVKGIMNGVKVSIILRNHVHVC